MIDEKISFDYSKKTERKQGNFFSSALENAIGL